MPTIRHRLLSATNGHIVHRFTYANTAAREGAVGLTAADVGKLARQLDDESWWTLVDAAPVTWKCVSLGAGGGGHAAFGTDGTVVANAVVSVRETVTSFGSTVYGELFETMLDSPGDTAQTVFGLWGQVRDLPGDVSNYTGTLTGIEGVIRHEGAGVFSTGVFPPTMACGVRGSIVSAAGSGNIVSGSCVSAFGFVEGTGITVGSGVSSGLSILAGVIGTWTNVVALTPLVVGGAINDVRGVSIADHSGIGAVTSYNLLSSGVNSYNIFEGRLGVGGVVAPNEDIEANDTIRANTAFNLNGADGISGTYPVSTGGVPGNLASITIAGGIITGVTVAP